MECPTNTDRAGVTVTAFGSRVARRVAIQIVLLSLPAMMLGGWLVWALWGAERDIVRKAGAVTAQHAVDTLDRLVYERYGDTLLLAGSPAAQVLDPTKLTALADQLVATYTPYYELALAADRQGHIVAVSQRGASGQPIASTPLLGESVAETRWFQAAVQGAQPVWIEDVHLDPLIERVYGDRHPVLSLSAPIRSRAGEVIGVWSTRVALAPLADSLALMKSSSPSLGPAPMSLLLVNREGQALAEIPQSGVVAPLLAGQTNAHDQAPLAVAGSTGFAAYAGLGWEVRAYLLGGLPNGPLVLFWGLTSLLLFLGGAGAAFFWGMHRRVLLPLIQMGQVIKRLGQGELPSTALLPPSPHDDEIGDLIRSTHATAQQLITHHARLEGLNTISRTLQQAQVMEMTVSRRDEFLNLVLQEAVQLTGARYGAIGVFDEAGESLTQFLTVGVDEATKAAIGALPTGRGLLGILKHEDHPVRLTNLSAHAEAVGFPPHHPEMHSFLGMSIKAHGRLYGRIYLTEKEGADAFSADDEVLLSALAAHAGVAIEDGEYVRQLHRAEARYRHLLESTGEGIYGLDLDGRCTFINKAGSAMLGYQPDELLGQPMHTLIHHTRRDGSPYPVEACSIYQAFRTGQGCRLDDELLWRKDGTCFPAEFCSNPILEGDRIIGSVATFSDISERKQAEAALLMKTEQLQTISEAMLTFLEHGDWKAASVHLLRKAMELTASEHGFIGVVAEGPALRILAHEGVVWHDTLNRAFYEETLQRYHEVGYVEFTCFENLFGRVITNGQPVLSNNPGQDPRAGGLPSGHPPLRSFLGVPICYGTTVVGMIGVANRHGGYRESEQDSIEALTRAAGVMYDSYYRQQREQHLEEHLRQAQKMEAVGRLAGGIAHDFNNLLMVMIGYSAMLLRQLEPTSPLHRYPLEIKKAGERAAALTHQLLAFSRRQFLAPKVLSLNTSVVALEEMLRRLLGEHIHLVFDLAPTLASIKADTSQLEQVIMNLALNARDAMPTGGTITIRTANVDLGARPANSSVDRPWGPCVRLTVHDTGHGMDEATQARIFEPFFTTKAFGKGTGLGLATVYGIVVQSGGAISVESHLGQGTTFLVHFPAVEEAPQQTTPVDALPDLARGSETIMLVEDEEALRNLVQHTLGEAGFHVLSARTGPEALALSGQHAGPIHMLVTDVVMPEMSGVELSARLRNSRPSLQVIYMSGYPDVTMFVQGAGEPSLHFLQKPFPLGQLLEMVRKVLIDPKPENSAGRT